MKRVILTGGTGFVGANRARRLLRDGHEVHLPTLRLDSVFGPYEDPGRLLPTLIKHGLKGTLPPLAAPDVARDFVYVADVVEAFFSVRMP